MKRKKLLKTLAEFLDSEGRKQRKHRVELETLLAKLEKKQAELEEKIKAEKAGRRQERLKMELGIVKAQHAKGVETLQGLEES